MEDSNKQPIIVLFHIWQITCSTQCPTANNVIKWLVLCWYFMKFYRARILANLLIVLLFRVNLIAAKFVWMLSGNDPCSERFLGARLGYLHRNLVAQASNLGALGYRAPVRQQPCHYMQENTTLFGRTCEANGQLFHRPLLLSQRVCPWCC